MTTLALALVAVLVLLTLAVGGNHDLAADNRRLRRALADKEEK